MLANQPILDHETVNVANFLEGMAGGVLPGEPSREINDQISARCNNVKCFECLGHLLEAISGRLDLGLQVRESAASRKDDLGIRRQVLRGGVEVSAFYQT
jgi:hypothetical protein